MLLDAGSASWLADAADTAATAASAAATDPSWFDSLVVLPFEFAIVQLHGLLQALGVKEAYGPAIILFTISVKLFTLPLTKTQLESTTKMQAIQPAAKKLQDKYKETNPERLNMELQKLYTENQVNPLAGCVPALAQIPLFIGLYRALLNLAKENKLTESFLFLPSLEGPTPDYTQGIKWLTDDWANGAPALGWHDTFCYLALPVVLVISQYVSTSILSPKSDDPAQAQSQAILKFLPLMIGWFALQVPSGLGIYWLTNNFLTTITTVLVKRSITVPDVSSSSAASAPVMEPPKPQGFGRRYGEIVEKTDASTGTKVTIKPPGASKAPSVVDVAPMTTASDVVIDSDAVSAPATTASSDAPVAAKPSKKRKKKRKKRN